ncbi:MAG: hypothetical protein CBE26_02630 [Kiritimatiellaceae bacterium TMED266]|nr:MAG: hypothetical protein CBE26_02630 [Kiritimatiellaceae bacterium TMED266]
MKKYLFIYCLLPALLFAQGSLKPDQIDFYKKTPQVDLHLHTFLPPATDQAESRPAILFFFGGGWNSGSPSHFYRQAKHFAQLGLVTFCAEYRVRSREGVTPDYCVRDARSAMRYIREHAKKWNIDPNRIAAGGGSAGGHPAAPTATPTHLNDSQDNLDVSPTPQALLLFNPALDTSRGESRFGELAMQISPLHHMQKNMPPTLILHGTADTTVPHSQAVDFRNAMKKAGHRCELRLYEDMPHGFFNKKKYDETLEEAENFIRSLGWIE